MGNWSRRDVLKLGLAGWALSAGLPRRLLAGPRLTPSGPRYVMVIFLGGGIDSVYTTDPKVRADVDPWVDVPFKPNEIVEAGGLRLGPHFAPLAKWAGKMAIVNGVQVQTANHHTGGLQAIRFKTGVHTSMPSVMDVIGSVRDGQPLGSISLGTLSERDCSPGFFGVPIDPRPGSPGKNILDYAEENTPADLEELAAVLKKNAVQFRNNGGEKAATTADNLDQTAALFGRLPHVAPFRLEKWAEHKGHQAASYNLQRALWAFQNDLTRCAYVHLNGLMWDTHEHNARGQTMHTTNFVAMFAKFVAELERTGLLSKTLVVLSSEVGRFPRINDAHGKDHFPEIPVVFLGAGINTQGGRGAVYGHTGKHMEGRPISLKTGKESSGGHSLLLDDVGTTLLHMTGVKDPASMGYFGKVMEFLV